MCVYICTNIREENFFNRIHASNERLVKHCLLSTTAAVQSWHGFLCHYSSDIAVDYIIQSEGIFSLNMT